MNGSIRLKANGHKVVMLVGPIQEFQLATCRSKAAAARTARQAGAALENILVGERFASWQPLVARLRDTLKSGA